MAQLKQSPSLQWCAVLITRHPEVNDSIAQIVFIDACQCTTKPLITIQKESWCGLDLQPDHQFLQAVQICLCENFDQQAICSVVVCAANISRSIAIHMLCKHLNEHSWLTLVSEVSSPMMSRNMASWNCSARRWNFLLNILHGRQPWALHISTMRLPGLCSITSWNSCEECSCTQKKSQLAYCCKVNLKAHVVSTFHELTEVTVGGAAVLSAAAADTQAVSVARC